MAKRLRTSKRIPGAKCGMIDLRLGVELHRDFFTAASFVEKAKLRPNRRQKPQFSLGGATLEGREGGFADRMKQV